MVLQLSLVADLIELVRIKWVGVETCNRPGGRVNIYRAVQCTCSEFTYSLPTLYCMLSRYSVPTVYGANIYRRYSVPAVSVLIVYLQCTNSV